VTGPRILRLTPREIDVLNELCLDGPTNGDIAERLDLEENTVKSHLKAILRKSCYRNRTELVVAILRGRCRIVPQDRRGQHFRNDLQVSA